MNCKHGNNRGLAACGLCDDLESEYMRGRKEAIAALSAQEPFGFIEPETGNFCWLEDAKRCPKDAATYTLACYAAPPAQADTKQAEPCPWVRQSSEGTAYCELAESGAKQAKTLSPWLPIESAPRAYSPPISLYNHHAPLILGVHGQSFYFLCRWGGKSKGCWVSDYYEKLPFQPTHWMPLPAPPALHQLGAKVEVSDG